MTAKRRLPGEFCARGLYTTKPMRRRLVAEQLEDRRLMAVDWRNPVDSLDVSSDQFITPIDALLIINEINSNSSRRLPDSKPEHAPFLDTSGDQFVSPLDALLVINALNVGANSTRELDESATRLVDEAFVTMTVGQMSGTRRLRFEIATTFDTLDTDSASGDILNVYILDPQDRSTTLLDRGADGSAIFSLHEQGYEMLQGLVTWSGNTLEVDVGGLAQRDTVLVKLQLIHGDLDLGTTASVKPVANELLPETEVPLSILDERDVAGSSGIIEPLFFTQQVPFATKLENVRYDPATSIYEAELSVQNLGRPVGRDIGLAFPNLPRNAALLNVSGLAGLTPYLNMRNAIPSGGLATNAWSKPLRLQIRAENESQVDFTPGYLLGLSNSPPALMRLDPITIVPGTRVEIPIEASDRDGDLISFSVRGDSFPGLTLDPTGALRIAPSPNQLGTYALTVIASDGAASDQMDLQINVVADSLTTSRLTGQILGTDSAPLAGVQVEVGSVASLTSADGRFELDLGSGALATDTLRVRGDLYTSVNGKYPFIAEKIGLMLGHDFYRGFRNSIQRPIYLPILNSGTPVDPLSDSVITQTLRVGEAPVSVEVARGTLFGQLGSLFTGALSITEVPLNRTPAAIPEGLSPDLIVTIQPGEMNFSVPTALNLPNRTGYRPGLVMDLWSIDPVTGEFKDVGDMQVSADGRIIETVSGGIRNSSWHFTVPQTTVTINETKLPDCACSCTVPAMSEFDPYTGAHIVSYQLTGYQSQGQYRNLEFVYDSHRANPTTVLTFSQRLQLLTRRGVPIEGTPVLYANAQYSVNNLIQKIPGPLLNTPMWTLGDAEEGDLLSGSMVADLQTLPSGIVEYEIAAGFGLAQSDGILGSLSQPVRGQILNINESDSPFGSGWGLADLDRLILSAGTSSGAGASALLIDGSGQEYVFRASAVPGQFQSPQGDFSVLETLANGQFQRTMPNRLTSLFSSTGQLISRTDRLGNTTQYAYRDGRLDKIIDPVGLTTSFVYHDGKLSQVQFPDGRITRFTIDGAGNLNRIVEPDNSAHEFAYDHKHLLVSEKDARGNVKRSRYDSSGRLASAVNADGSSMHFVSIENASFQGRDPLSSRQNLADARNIKVAERQATVVQPGGNLVRLTLNADGAIVGSRDSVAETISQRNAQGKIVSQIGPRGKLTETEYDVVGNIIQVKETLASGAASISPLPSRTYSLQGATVDMAAGDFNSDGNLDVVALNNDLGTPKLQFLNGDGQGRLTLGTVERLTGGLVAVASGDFNLDGLSDLALVDGFNRELVVLEGVGDGTFTAGRKVETVFTDAAKILVTDFNNDGQSDLAVSSIGHFATEGIVQIYMGDGEGNFSAKPSISVGTLPFGMTVGDWNNDDLVDLATLNAGAESISVLLNSGSGNLAVHKTIRGQDLQLDLRETRSSISSGQLAGNDNLDLVISAPRSGVLMTLAGDGQGDFTVASRTTFNAGPVAIATVNFDNDSDLDLVTLNAEDALPDSIAFHSGDGTGAFANIATTLFSASDGTGQLLMVDLNGDNVQDAVASNSFNSTVMVVLSQENGGVDTPISVSHPTQNIASSAVEIAVLQPGQSTRLIVTDRDLNRVIVSSRGNDGRYTIEQTLAVENQSSPSGRSPMDLVVEDLNKDGLADIATANRDSSNVALFFGQTSGGFLRQSDLSVGANPNLIAAADIDGDGHKDLITGNFSSGTHSITVLFNGSSGYQNARLDVAIPGRIGDLQVADLDGDGRADIVLANEQAINVLRGRTDRNLTAESITINAARAVALALGDVDDDGKLDVVAQMQFPASLQVFSRGSGQSFQLASQMSIDSQEIADLNRMVLADVTLDGKLDVAVSNFDRASMLIYVGSNLGTFLPAIRVLGTSIQPTDIAVGDLNGDGLPEIAMSTRDVSDRTGFASVVEAKPIAGSTLVRTMTYDPVFHLLSSVTDELGRTTLYNRDASNGNLLSVDEQAGRVTSYTYSQSGQIRTATDALGRVTEYEYDGLGRLTRKYLAKGTSVEAFIEFRYDFSIAAAAGQPTSIRDENGNVTHLQYDNRLRLVQTSQPDPDGADPLGSPTFSYSYDQNGNLVQEIDAAGGITQYSYDALDRLVKVQQTDPDGNGAQGPSTTTYAYDNSGNLVQARDPLGNVTRFQYDPRGRRLRMIDAKGGVTRYTYDADSNLTSITDPTGNRTAYGFDLRNRLVSETDSSGRTRRFTYDGVDNLIKKLDRNRRVTNYTYDSLNQLRSETWVGDGRQFIYEYDLNGNLSSARDSSSSLTYTYDQRDRVSSVGNLNTPGAPQVVLSYGFDNKGNVISMSDSLNGGSFTRYQYDGLDRLTMLTQDLPGAQLDKRVDFTYNPMGGFASIDRFASLLGGTADVHTEYVYDARQRVQVIQHTNRQDVDVESFRFSYDTADRTTQISSPEGTSVYVYDANDRVTSVLYSQNSRTDEVYAYDASGNRIAQNLVPSSTEAANRLSSDGMYRYAYDFEGNVISQTRLSGAGPNGVTQQQFVWDYRNRLTAVKSFADSVLLDTTHFGYDALDRRIRIQTNTQTTHLIYDKHDIVIQTDEAIGLPTKTVRYLHGANVDEILASSSEQRGTNWALVDQLGSVHSWVNNAGETVLENIYDAFGNRTQRIGVADSSLLEFGYAGRELVPHLNLIHMRTRDYSPTTGRFMSEDTIGLAGGTNAYSYVNNSPVQYRDPYGTAPRRDGRGGMGGNRSSGNSDKSLRNPGADSFSGCVASKLLKKIPIFGIMDAFRDVGSAQVESIEDGFNAGLDSIIKGWAKATKAVKGAFDFLECFGGNAGDQPTAEPTPCQQPTPIRRPGFGTYVDSVFGSGYTDDSKHTYKPPFIYRPSQSRHPVDSLPDGYRYGGR